MYVLAFFSLSFIFHHSFMRAQLEKYAREYETASFINGDPSWFMHQVEGAHNREATAFVASALSYGSRKQFMPKIQAILDDACGDVDKWLRERRFEHRFKAGDSRSFYRLYSFSAMNRFFATYADLLAEYGTLGAYVRGRATDGFEAVEAITDYFRSHGSGGVVPKDATSACKRICMFLRWMVRSSSPVDLGLWADFIDRRTLLIPLDTHVLQEAQRLGLIKSRTASMSACRRLTTRLAEIFPDDPLRGDFALFGYGVDNSHAQI